jgi:hypothetical protein
VIVNRDYQEWLEHRAGITRSDTVAVARLQRALVGAPNLRQDVDAFGRREIWGFSGRLRLAALPPGCDAGAEACRTYLQPYVRDATSLLGVSAALVERAGDEFAFLTPDTAEDNGLRAERQVGFLLRDLLQFQRGLGGNYPLRLGLTYGRVSLSRVDHDDFQSWLVAGSPVVLARDLAAGLATDPVSGFAAAFGVTEGEAPLVPFGQLVSTLAGNWLRPSPPERQLPGTRATLLLPR